LKASGQAFILLVPPSTPRSWGSPGFPEGFSGTATFISLFRDVRGDRVALTQFPGAGSCEPHQHGVALPPVVVGLFVTIFLWERAAGFLEILYTPAAMILAQAIIATPS